jgi:centrosomal protein CEP164
MDTDSGSPYLIIPGKVDNVRRHIEGSGACGSGHYQESTEIIQSLENLNTEIREIWEVLNKQQKDGTSRQGEWLVALGSAT